MTVILIAIGIINMFFAVIHYFRDRYDEGAYFMACAAVMFILSDLK